MSAYKRKVDSDYSENPNTKKERRRQEKRSPEQAAYEKQKVSDNTAWSREKARVIKSVAYQNASEDQRIQIVNAANRNLIAKRFSPAM